MRLHRYFASRYLATFLVVFVIVGVILGSIDLMEEVDRFSGNGVSFCKMLQLTLLSAPKGLYEFLPLITILSSLALFSNLARSSELVVTRALGWSALRVLVAPVVIAALIGVAAATIFNPIVSGTSKRYESLSTRYRNGVESTFSIGADGLWLRQGTRDGQAVIYAASANAGGSEFHDVTFLLFDDRGAPSERIDATTARLAPGYWELESAKTWPLADTVNAEAASRKQDVMRIPSSLTSERITAPIGAHLSIPFWRMRTHIAQLEKVGFSARRPRVWFQTALAKPLFLAAMVVIGAAFTMRHGRSGHAGLMVLFAIISGLSLHFIRNFAQILGENGQIPVLVAAWAPPLAGFLLALGLILHLEDG